MRVKLFELRDKGTFIPIFAFRCMPEGSESQRYLLSRAGFGPHGSQLIVLGRLECSDTLRNCTYDPFAWADRTFHAAHAYVQEHFEELNDGAIIDVEFILNETPEPKLSEAVSVPDY